MGSNFGDEYHEISNGALLKLNSCFFDRLEEIAESFSESLTAACERVREMQRLGYGEIEYLEFTLLRTRLLEHDYRAPIMVYGKDWYADTNQAQVGSIDTSPIFSYYEDMIEGAGKLVKKYRMELPSQMLTMCMCDYAEQFWKYAAIALRRAVMGFSPGDMKITDEFRIRCCEYMGYGEVLRRHTPGMTQEHLEKWFDKRERDVYRFRDYSGRDFTGRNFAGMDFTGCDFSGCVLSGCDFEGADLTDAWFCGCDMREVNLSGVWLPGARFDRADLAGAVLEGAYCTCVISRKLWMRPDNVRPSFAWANLDGADLTFSAMEEADFTGASMREVQLNGSHRGYYALSEEQESQVQFEEEDPEDLEDLDPEDEEFEEEE